MSLKAKPFSEVKVGDFTVDCDCNEYAGKILAKGTFPELVKKYCSTVSVEELLDMEMAQEEIDTWDCVAISQEPGNTLEQYDNLIFFYDCDPSSVMVVQD